jgi:pimeloyl-ACP methyl ester carboxylesterase
MHRSRRPAPRRLAALAALASALVLVTAACTVGPSRRPELATAGPAVPAPTTSTASSTPRPTGPGGPGRTAAPIEWTTCPATVPAKSSDGTRFDIACAGVVVPVSYTDANQGSFAVRIARAVHDGTSADAPPLIVLDDPGRAGRNSVADVAAALPDEIQSHFAVITVDLRGTGGSNGIDCVGDSTQRAVLGMAADPSSSKGTDQLNSIARQLTFDCGDLVGASLTQFNSTNAADDLDTLRAALGVDALTILGRHYGATIAAVYADRYPGRVQALALDSPTDPLTASDKGPSSAAAAAARLLTDFSAACSGFDGGCPLGADPTGAVTALVKKLATSGDKAGSWTITGGSVLLALLHLLPDPGSWPTLATALADLADGKAKPLSDLLVETMGGDSLPERLTGRILYLCNDTADRLTGSRLTDAVADARSASALFGPFAVSLAGLCSSWPAPDDPLGRLTADGAPPILVIGSVNNPLHPYPGVQSLAAQLASGVLLSWQSGTDGAYPANACVTKSVDDYLLHGTVPSLGVLCPP